MRETACFLLLLSVVAFPISVQAQFEEPPIISLSDAEREVRAAATADSEFSESNQLWTLQGPFIHFESAQEAGKFGSTASTQAEQDSQISIFSIRGTGSAEGSAILGGAEDASVRAHSISRIAVSFSLPVDAPYSLSGTFAATGEDGGNCLSFTNVSFVGFDPNGFPFFHSQSFKCDSPPENASFFFTGTVGANTVLALSVEASVDPGSHDKISGFGVGTASFDVLLDFGDRDGDGLLDAWEEMGIDFPGPGVEIDLPGLGANPDKKDLFIEVDVMDGVTYDQEAIDAVELAFALAPASMVDNPDDTLGIQLHMETDGDRPPHQPLVADSQLPPQFYSTKDAYFGSEDDRNHPDWDDIRRAKLLIYRYCLWADTLFRDKSKTDHALGRAEAVPSNDFVVAAGRVMTSNPKTSTRALAGTFMHELGHTLGLQHGGQDDDNNKPNYLSVMNYAYSIPFDRMTSAGGSVADFWRLDYSRSTMTGLDETELYETQGLGGPQGRLIFFNYKEETDPEPVKRGATWADRVTINWNGDQNDPDVAPYQLDITRNDSSEPADYDATLESYTDWDRLWYHLLGTPEFDDRKPSPVATRAEALKEATLEAFANVEWTDFTLLDDLIFSNGFELGSTTAWSDAVP